MESAGSKLPTKQRLYQKHARLFFATTLIPMMLSLALSSCKSESEVTTPDIIADKVWINSDGSNFTPQSYYADFSWDTTPLYTMFGASWTLLDSEQQSFISEHANFITIEKNHGASVLGYAEFGAQHEAAALKTLDPRNTVLYYFNAAYAWPFTSYNEDFTAENIDKDPDLKAFLLVDETTGQLYERDGVYYFDVLNEDFRAWWVKAVVDGVEVSATDGVFIDQMHGFSFLRWEEKDDVYAAMGEMMADLKASLPSDKILLANNGADQPLVFPSADAFMFEHYNEDKISKENLLQEWDDMLRIAQAGKMSVYRIGVDIEADALALLDQLSSTEKTDFLEQYSQDRAEYFLATFLIGAQPYSYLQYGWGFSLYDGGSLVNYPAFSNALGAPLAAYTRTSMDDWQFTREFEHASVWVDTENREGKITWK